MAGHGEKDIHGVDLLIDSDPPVYYQRFEYDGRFGQAKHEYYRDFLDVAEYGAMHGDDLGYIFSPYNAEQAVAQPEEFREEWRVHRWTVELMANFVKHGNPTPTRSLYSNVTWPAVNRNGSRNTYLNIDKTFELRELDDDVTLNRWEKVYNCLYYEMCDQILS
uniref:COesterase domain-containing protein n=1 Tax=Anopheles dirus TaxID=7168 RepID=A0A182MY40_9DIPT